MVVLGGWVRARLCLAVRARGLSAMHRRFGTPLPTEEVEGFRRVIAQAEEVDEDRAVERSAGLHSAAPQLGVLRGR